jgi:Tfp pilus assembly protein PilN
MPQQINLCSSIFVTQKQQVSALAILKSLAAFLVLGTGLAVYWNWSLQRIDTVYRQSISSKQQELKRLQAEIRLNRERNAPADAAMSKALQQQRDELRSQEQLLTELGRGLSLPDRGHSARLLLLAKTIPAQVWVTEVKVDDVRFEISGFTLEPSALNIWMARLGQSPLLQGQQLSAVKVERAENDSRQGANTASSAPGLINVAKSGAANVWAYNIVSAVAQAGSREQQAVNP